MRGKIMFSFFPIKERLCSTDLKMLSVWGYVLNHRLSKIESQRQGIKLYAQKQNRLST